MFRALIGRGWGAGAQSRCAMGFLIFAALFPGQAAAQPGKAHDEFSVRQDPRLRVHLLIHGDDITLSAYLGRLEMATGLKFTADGGPEKVDAVNFGRVQSGKGGQAWVYMNMLLSLVEAQRWIKPRWVETADGFMLMADGIAPPKPRPKKEDRFALRRDPKLQAKLTLTGADLRLSDVLGQVQKVSGVALAIDRRLGEHDPQFGQVQMAETYAWAVMEMAARKQLKGGRWEKTPDGYRLTADGSLPEKAAANPEASKEAAQRRQEIVSRFPLRADQRLNARLSIVDKGPRLSRLLSDLERTTNLRFTRGPSLTDHDPKFGSVQFRNVHAWTVMEMIAETQLQDGRWEKTDTGYRLIGTSLAPQPPAESTPAPPLLNYLAMDLVVAASLFMLGLCLAALARPLLPKIRAPRKA